MVVEERRRVGETRGVGETRRPEIPWVVGDRIGGHRFRSIEAARNSRQEPTWLEDTQSYSSEPLWTAR
jgi:hypothetical protein